MTGMTTMDEGQDRKPRSERGMSLVEVLIASLVIALSVIAVVAFVRKGPDMLAIDNHRRMARGIIERTLESDKYQPENFNNLVTTSATTSVVIDSERTPQLLGTFITAVSDSQPKVNNHPATYRTVTATVWWTEAAGRNDTVKMIKWLTNVSRD